MAGPGKGVEPDSEHYSEEETVARREAALKRMLSTPPKSRKPRQQVRTGKRQKD